MVYLQNYLSNNLSIFTTVMWDDGSGGIDGLDGAASSHIVGALASIIFPMLHKILNDGKTLTTRFWCEWVNVSSGTSQPG